MMGEFEVVSRRRRLAHASLVNIYDLDKPKPVQSLSGHSSFVYDVTALPDGSGAITSGEDGTLRVWSSEYSREAIDLGQR